MIDMIRSRNPLIYAIHMEEREHNDNYERFKKRDLSLK